MKPTEFRLQVIRPALSVLALPGGLSDSSEDLLLGTAIQESGLRNIRQIGGGPARGYFQMESSTYEDCWVNYLNQRPALADKLRQLCAPDPPSVAELIGCPKFAAGMARIKYLRAPEQLPPRGDIEAYARYWKRIYNAGGSGTVEEFVRNWHQAVNDADADVGGSAHKSPDQEV